MLPDLQLVLFFIDFIVKNFQKIFIRRFAIGCMIIYYTIIISNISNKFINCIKFRVVKH